MIKFLNIIMSVVLVSVFKLDLRALAFSAAFSANLMGLCSIIVANKRSKGIVNKDFKITIFKILVSSVIMSVFVIVTDNLIKTSSAFIAAVVPTAVGIATYFVCCMVFKIEEVKSLLTKLTSKFKK